MREWARLALLVVVVGVAIRCGMTESPVTPEKPSGAQTADGPGRLRAQDIPIPAPVTSGMPGPITSGVPIPVPVSSPNPPIPGPVTSGAPIPVPVSSPQPPIPGPVTSGLPIPQPTGGGGTPVPSPTPIPTPTAAPTPTPTPTASCVPPPGVGESEPNDGPARVGISDYSQGLAQGPYTADITLSGRISPAGDEDAFAIRNPTGASINVHIFVRGQCETAPAAGPGDLVLDVYDNTGTKVTSSDDGGVGFCPEFLALAIPASTTYYLNLRDFGDNDPGCYSLTLDFP